MTAPLAEPRVLLTDLNVEVHSDMVLPLFCILLSSSSLGSICFDFCDSGPVLQVLDFSGSH